MVCVIMDSLMMMAKGSYFVLFKALNLLQQQYLIVLLFFFFIILPNQHHLYSVSKTKNVQKVERFPFGVKKKSISDNPSGEHDYDPYKHRDVAHPIT